MKIQGKTIWIVDAINPLGRALALALNQQGNFVIASGANADALGQLERDSGGAIVKLALDFKDSAAVRLIGQRLLTLTDRLDIVVANTRAREVFELASFDAELCVRQINTNYLAMVKALEIAMPLLLRSSSPYIVCTGSAMTQLPQAGAEAYGASEAAREYFARALVLALREKPVDLSMVRLAELLPTAEPGYGHDSRFTVGAEDAAQQLLRGMEKRRPLILIPRALGWLLAIANHLPERWRNGILANINRQNGVIW